MGQALVTTAAFFTGAGAGTGVVTPAPGDTVAVPSFDPSAKAYLESLSAAGALVDFVRVRSPRMHDNNQGIRLWVGAPTNVPLLPWGVNEVLFSSDVPTVEIDVTAAGSGVILLQYGFSDLMGVNPRLSTEADVMARVQHISAVEVDVTAGAIGAWGNGVAINANFDNFEAGYDYALLGYTSSVAVAGISLQGPDTSGLKIGGPGSNDPKVTRDYFVQLSNGSGRPYIPIIAANNKQATRLQAVDVAAATATKVSLIFAELG